MSGMTEAEQMWFESKVINDNWAADSDADNEELSYEDSDYRKKRNLLSTRSNRKWLTKLDNTNMLFKSILERKLAGIA